jgi:hypothetical protein
MAYRDPEQRRRDAERARELQACGLTREEISRVLGVALSTVGDLLRHPETGALYRDGVKRSGGWPERYPASVAERLRERRRAERERQGNARAASVAYKSVVEPTVRAIVWDLPTDPEHPVLTVRVLDHGGELLVMGAGDNPDDALLGVIDALLP